MGITGGYLHSVHPDVPASATNGTVSLYHFMGGYAPPTTGPTAVLPQQPNTCPEGKLARCADHLLRAPPSPPPPTPTPNPQPPTPTPTPHRAAMGPRTVPEAWRLDIAPTADPAVLASSLAIPHCWSDNGCKAGTFPALRHTAAVIEAVRGRLVVVSALYGPTPVTRDIQAMIDSGVRGVHFSPLMANYTHVVPEIVYLGDLVNW
jgi:hypothetical protein